MTTILTLYFWLQDIFIPRKAEQRLQGMELQEKEDKKIKTYRKYL